MCNIKQKVPNILHISNQKGYLHLKRYWAKLNSKIGLELASACKFNEALVNGQIAGQDVNFFCCTPSPFLIE